MLAKVVLLSQLALTVYHDDQKLGCPFFFCYYLTWISCIFFVALNKFYEALLSMMVIFSFQIIFETIKQRSLSNALFYGVALMVMGSIIDKIWLRSGLISYNSNPFNPYFCPPWITLLWLSFGFNLITFIKVFMIPSVLIGIIAFPSIISAYWLGVRLGAAVANSFWFYIYLGGIWSLILPLSLKIFNHLKRGCT
ncbi:hypothetical protein Lbru_1645 [Legionella brunensis]|uniref:Transmembrane protein n=2 Tax=Legionella brunensis TaxID=29422 RepID=A0A0W0SKG6_9GAMM|nr:DUF2878 family protein [Legionella brunensis]KTC83822.1 hypothetical protein Lbru_1645 [Legionella brunensis]